MKNSITFLALLASLLASACGAAVPTSSPAAPGQNGVNLLVDVQGNPAVKRPGWTDYAPALFGMVLHSGDLLRTDSGAQATVACADLTLAKSSAGVSNVPCKVAKPVLVYGDSLIIPTRAAAPEGIPLVLSPRKTRILSSHPLLRWSAVPGAGVYKVSVRGPNLTWSADVTGTSEIAYPDGAPALQPGVTYKLSVAAGNRSSDEESAAGLGFTLLKPDEAQAVKDSEARIRALGLSDAATRLLLANLYAGQGLTAEATNQLENVAQVDAGPAVARTLGDLYLNAGLNRQAEQSYSRALSLSQKANDIEGQAAAQNALGLVYESLGNTAEAITRGQQAITWYQKLGDGATVKQIQDRLASLQKQ